MNSNVPKADLLKIVNTFPSKPIYLQEVGYQTSTECGSSEEKQAEFFCHFFEAWDIHKDRITHASILRMVDALLTSAQNTASNYGLPGNLPFIEYIRTLGLRSYTGNGTDKKAIAAIMTETSERGW